MEMEVVGNGAKKKEGTVCVCLILIVGLAWRQSILSHSISGRLEEMEDVDDAKGSEATIDEY